ncbi:hypothetical protein EJ08DRAFT_388460 [Tothia fuscella]|uniref:Fungal N-terminal domain-containing protein n=1 Tax=Tothia fuscella TaxID=1048955 RepID=A0A9P4P1Q9_9PEZI|nr:hypothetical protein EJ08DRAFT_388460 [Tothia fuscella]
MPALPATTTTTVASMSNDNITTVLQMVAWGTRLSFGLYDFSANVTSASGDVNSLAKEVNLLSLVLRQIGANLRQDGRIASERAYDTVESCLRQCRDVFAEIEQIVPVRALEGAQSDDMQLVTRLRDGLDWNILSQAKTQYLLAHLESLKLTMSVMLQVIYTAKICAWARRENSQHAADAVLTERTQTEVLIIEQQLSLLRASRRYDEYKQQVAATPLLLEQSPQSQALVRRDQFGPNPGALVVYQEPSLARTAPSANESQDIGRIRRISSPYVDILLGRWTKLPDIDERMKKMALHDSRPKSRQPEIRQRRNSNFRPAGVESDSDSDEEYAANTRRPRLNVGTAGPGPLLTPMNGDSRSDIASPIPINGTGLRPTTGPYSPIPMANSWTPSTNTGAYFPNSTGSRSGNLTANTSPQTSYRPRPSPSPVSSPRTCYLSDHAASTHRPATAFKSTQQVPPPPPPPQRPVIPWRLRNKHNFWDFNDQNLSGSNNSNPPSSVHHDKNTVTEVMAEFVSHHALRDLGHEYTRVKKEVGDRRKTSFETCYCIEGALTFNEIMRLVDLTARVRNPQPPRGSSNPQRTPQFERSHTAPSTPRASGSLHSQSGTSDEDSGRRSESRVRRDKSRSRRDSDVRRGGERGGDRERDGEGRKKTATLTKLAMGGAGMMTLLDGLPEVLGYLV